MKNLPVGIQSFADLIGRGYLYVDKTPQIHRLLAEAGKFYFFARPRRFGKSLLISTLYELFSGNRQLFENLWIYDKIQWEKYPIIHIDFLKVDFSTPQAMDLSLRKLINKIAKEYDVAREIDDKADFKESFANLIECLAKSTQRQVVILIDEYDKPIIDFIETEKIEKAKANQSALRYFYSVLKSSDKYIRFAFITGVSKFTRVSIFSDVNNLYDITIADNFSTLLGITHDELQEYFADRMDELNRKLGTSKDELASQVKQWYNGYSWDGQNFLYNPQSVLNLFARGRFGNYWFSTGTPTFLINYIKRQNRAMPSFEEETVDESVFDSYDIENLGITSMLFQTGYLTIKEIRPITVAKSLYVLSYPNLEVKESFLKHFLASYPGEEAGKIGSRVLDLMNAVEDNDLERFFKTLRAIFASVPSHLFINDREAYYHTVIYLVLKLVGVYIDVEVHTNKGRIDAVIETKTHIYIMEFKLGTAGEALAQIQARDYPQKYLSSGKTIGLVGIGFDTREKNIGDYSVAEHRT